MDDVVIESPLQDEKPVNAFPDFSEGQPGEDIEGINKFRQGIYKLFESSINKSPTPLEST